MYLKRHLPAGGRHRAVFVLRALTLLIAALPSFVTGGLRTPSPVAPATSLTTTPIGAPTAATHRGDLSAPLPLAGPVFDLAGVLDPTRAPHGHGGLEGPAVARAFAYAGAIARPASRPGVAPGRAGSDRPTGVFSPHRATAPPVPA